MLRPERGVLQLEKLTRLLRSLPAADTPRADTPLGVSLGVPQQELPAYMLPAELPAAVWLRLRGVAALVVICGCAIMPPPSAAPAQPPALVQGLRTRLLGHTGWKQPPPRETSTAVGDSGIGMAFMHSAGIWRVEIGSIDDADAIAVIDTAADAGATAIDSLAPVAAAGAAAAVSARAGAHC